MKELEDLTTLEKEILITFCDVNNYSLSSHIPIEAVNRRLKNLNRKLVKRTIKMLHSNGFIIKHPTKHRITYQLTKKGLKAGNQIRRDIEK